MFAFAAMLFIAGLLLFFNQTGWLRSFDRAKVKDEKSYAKYLGKSVASIGIVFLVSGLLDYLIPTYISAAILVAGFVFAIVLIVKHSKKHYE